MQQNNKIEGKQIFASSVLLLCFGLLSCQSSLERQINRFPDVPKAGQFTLRSCFCGESDPQFEDGAFILLERNEKGKRRDEIGLAEDPTHGVALRFFRCALANVHFYPKGYEGPLSENEAILSWETGVFEILFEEGKNSPYYRFAFVDDDELQMAYHHERGSEQSETRYHFDRDDGEYWYL